MGEVWLCRERLPWCLGPGEAPGFEPLELLGDGLLDDRGQVAVGHRGAHEGPQSLELVVKLGGGGELDLVATWGKGLDHRPTGPGERRAAAATRAKEARSRPPRLRLDAVQARARQLRPDAVGDRSKHPPADAVRQAPRRAGRAGGSATSSPLVCRAASASPPEHLYGARSPPRALRSRASTGERLASGGPPGSPGSGAAPASRWPSGAAARRPAWSGGGDALARRGRRRCGGRPRPRRGGGPRCSTPNIDGEASRA